MKINLTNKQYKILIDALEMSSFIYGQISDFVDDKFKKNISKIEDVEKYLLQFSKDFSFEKNLCKDCGELSLDEEYYMKILDDLDSYDEYQMFENLANKLGRRDFEKVYSLKEIKEISKKHNGYLGVPMYDFEKKYYDEFNSHGYDRLFIKE